MKLPPHKTSKEIRTLIIWAISEISKYNDFIKLCEKQIKKNSRLNIMKKKYELDRKKN